MKKALLMLYWGCLWSAYVVGMPDKSLPIASSSDGSSQRMRMLNEEGIQDKEKDLISVTNRLEALEVPGLSRDSKYPVEGMEYLQLILDQSQMRLSAKLEELSAKEKYLDDESERNPFVKAKQREIDDRDSIIAEQKNSLEQSRAIIIGLEEKNRINQQEIGSRDSIIADKEEDLRQSRAIITGLEETNRVNQQEIGSRDSIIAEKEEDLKQSKETILSLEEKDRVNQQKINEQSRVINKQSKELSKKNEEVFSLKERNNFLEEEIQKKDQQIQIRDKKLDLVEGERNKYKMRSQSYESNFKLLWDSVNAYVVAWGGDLKKRFDSAKSIGEKMAIVVAHLIELNARSGGIVRKREMVGAPSKGKDLTLNAIVEDARHDYFQTSGNGDGSSPMGRYKYKGEKSGQGLPDGEGEITDPGGTMKIGGTFEEGFLNIAEPLTVKGHNFNYVFRFPAELDEKYRDLISFVDISEMECSFGVGTLILRGETVNFVFNENYVYVGNLDGCDFPSGLGVKFCKDGEIQDGEFLDGYFMGEGDVNPAKRKRI